METAPDKTADLILKSPSLLNDFVLAIERLGHRGEHAIKKILLLTFLSSRRKKPISTTVQGESSSGKSSTLDHVKELVPGKDVVDLSSITAASLWNLPVDAVKHKTIVIAERAGSSGADYPIRTLQSEGKLTRLCSTPTESGSWITKEQRIEGPCAFIQTTTSVQSGRNAENETRTFILHSDDSEELTREVLQAQKGSFQLNRSVSEKDRLALSRAWKEAFKQLKPLRVIIPYADAIKFPTRPVRVRRDQNRFLSLIELSAHIHQVQRAIETHDSEDVIIASTHDYRVAYDLMMPLMASSLEEVSLKLKELDGKLRTAQVSSFTYSSAAQLTDWDRKTAIKYVNEGMDAGYYHAPKGIKTGVESSFILTNLSKRLSRQLSISTPEEIEATQLPNSVGQVSGQVK